MLQSDRLYYKKLDADDFDLFSELYTDDNVMKYTFLDAQKTQKALKELFEQVLVGQEQPNQDTQYVARRKDNNIPVGIVDYEVELLPEKGGIFEIGYIVLPKQQRQGFAIEMSRALTDYLFENFKIHKISGHCHAKNMGSKSIMEKLGMRMEGINRQARYKEGKWDDELMFGILREEWADAKKLKS